MAALERSSSTNRHFKLLRSVSQKFLHRNSTRRSDGANAGGCWKFGRSMRSVEGKSEEDEPSRHKGHSADLPDELVELCLARTSFASLQVARSVCRRWRDMTTTPYFLQKRSYTTTATRPWLLVFGLSRDGLCIAKALDTSTQKWHTIRVDKSLDGRIFYTAAATSCSAKVFIVGGSSVRVEGGAATSKTLQDVLELDVAASRWRKTSPMRAARDAPVAVAFRIPDKRRIFALAAAAERRRCGGDAEEGGGGGDGGRGLIVVGGLGHFNEPLNSGEIYDADLDMWVDIDDWPKELGTICSGVVSGNLFFGYSDIDKLGVYDFAVGHWRRIAMSYIPDRIRDIIPRLVACGDDGSVYLIAVAAMQGGGGIYHARMVWRLVLEEGQSSSSDDGTWIQVCQHPDAPLDWNGVFFSHGNKIYGLEMFKIMAQMLDFVTVCQISSSSSMTPPQWDRVTRQRMGHNLDASSCFTKTAVLVQL